MHPKALLDACAELVRQVLRFEHPADAVVSRYFREHRQLGSRERATLAETAYHLLRHRLRLEHLARSGTGPRERRLAILAFQGAPSFLQAALTEGEQQWLAEVQAVPEADLLPQHQHNLPEWLAQRLQAQVGDDFGALAQSLNQPAPLDLRVNELKTKRTQVLAALHKDNLGGEATPWSPWGIRLQDKPALQKWPLFTQGNIEVQDEGSQLLALLLEAKRSEMVADFCAGAGGKTLALGASMRNTGRLYAFDVSAHRLDALKPRLARSGLSNVHPVAIAHERDDRIKRLSGKLDRVLVDAPCSGLGTLRRNPDLKWRQNPEAVADLQAKQLAILSSAARLLKPGGRLVYATCSLLDEENEQVVEQFEQAMKAQHAVFNRLNAADILGRHMSADAAQQLCNGPFLRLWPHRHQTDGFFAAVWQKA